jgi:hypothetical protein
MKIISADITGSLIINNQDVTTTVESSSIWSGSIASRVTNLEQFSSSLDATFATDQQLNQATSSLSGSIALLSSSYLATSQSYDIVSSSFSQVSGSFVTVSSSYSAASGSFSTRVTTLEAASSSLNTASGSFSTRVTNNEATGSSLTTASGSFSTRVTTIESKYATTGSNTYTGPQYINEGSNAIGFTSTASLYTDGGLRVTKDAFVSGTLYLNNLTVFGTSSIQYVTSSQLNVGTNIITVNTDTPAIRFGGLSVYDSGSTGLTGSILWDSEDNQWIYSNPSGSTYDSAVFLVGPRNSGVIGNEPGITCNFLSKGNGLHHMTSSGIFEDGSRTCFYGSSIITSTGVGCFSGAVCASSVASTGTITGTTIYGSTAICGGTVSGTTGTFSSCVRAASLGIGNNISGFGNIVEISNTNANVYPRVNRSSTSYEAGWKLGTGGSDSWYIGLRSADGVGSYHFYSYTTNSTVLAITCNGIACFSGTVCSPILLATSYVASDYHRDSRLQSLIAYLGSNQIRVGSGLSDDFVTVATGATERLRITCLGVACFSGTVCASSFSGAGTGLTGTASSLSIGGTAANATNASYASTAGSAAAVPWSGVLAGTRTNYTLKFQPPSEDFAGFEFTGTNGSGAGYFLIRGTSDSGVYTAEGITLVADQGWATIAQRTRSDRGVRIMTGASSSTRICVLASGETLFNSNICVTGALSMATSGTNYIRMGVFPYAGTNSGEAWIGRASDRNAGTMTVQLGGNSASNRQFEVVDYAWTVVLASVSSGGTFSASGDVIAYASDCRLKQNVVPITNALGKIKCINGVSYTWKDGTECLGFTPTSKQDVGVLAQEIQKVLPEVVKPAPFDQMNGESKSGENYLTVKYEKIVPLLIEAIKEQQCQIEYLKSKIG